MTVETPGCIQVSGLPFDLGTEVEVLIQPKRPSAAVFRAGWDELCRRMREKTRNQNLSDEDIQQEIHEHRAGR